MFRSEVIPNPTPAQGSVADRAAALLSSTGAVFDGVPLWKHTARPGLDWWKKTPASPQAQFTGGQWGTVDQAEALWLDLPDADREEFKKLAVSVGAVSKNPSAAELFSTWGSAVSQAKKYNDAQGDKVSRYVSPWEVMTRLAMKTIAGANGSYDGFVGTRTSTQKQTFNTGTVSGNLDTILHDELGRAPTAEEVATYTRVLQRAADASPVVQRTTTDASGNTTSTQSGGIDAAQVLKDRAQGTPEAGRYQAATTYYQALQQALGAPA